MTGIPLRCRSCAATIIQSRSLSSTAPTLKVGPESPLFIEVPQARQQRYPPRRQLKGVLPIPRKLFPRNGTNKTSADYLAATTPEPTKREASPASSSKSQQEDYIAWKRRLATARRQNLRESLIGLRQRKDRIDRAIAYRGAQRSEERERLVNQKQREDDRLTGPTITAAMKKLQLGSLPDPDREQRVGEQQSRYLSKQAEKDTQRKDTLHTLYMHAQDFITSEAQLVDEIERTFKPVPTEWAGDVAGGNIWNTGPPDTVQDMLNSVDQADGKAIRRHEGYARLTQERVTRIAEELTGGKM